MDQLLNATEANQEYQKLLDGYMDYNSIYDKANHIRSCIDGVLRMAYATMKYLQTKVRQNEIKNPQNEIIDELLPGSKYASYRVALHKSRVTLNNKAMHRYELERDGKPKLTEQEYKQSLTAIINFIALVSGVPIPPPLLCAKETLLPIQIRDDARVDVIFLAQLYSNIGQLEDGAFIMDQFKKMLDEKKRIRLHSLSAQLVAYAPQLTLGDYPAFRESSEMSAPAGNSRALSTALDLLDAAIERQSDVGGDKPWLIWLAFDLSDHPDSAQVARLQQVMDKKVAGIYPMALTRSAHKQFTALWPECGPKHLDPGLAHNFFFNSLLLTIQTMHAL